MAYIYFQNNPLNKSVGDCVIRAVSKAMDMDWETTYMELAIQGLCMSDLPNSDAVWGGYLFLNGFDRYPIETICPDCYTVKDFCREHPYGIYVLGTGSHAICAINGDYFDIFDSGEEIPIYVWEKVR